MACIPAPRVIFWTPWSRWDFYCARMAIIPTLRPPIRFSTNISHRISAGCLKCPTTVSMASGVTSPKLSGPVCRRTKRAAGGVPLFEALYADPARLKSFLAAMSAISHGANMIIASKFPWARYKTFADAGAAQGDLAVQIALTNPHLSGIGFDLAEVGPIFEEYVEKSGVTGRLRFVAGSFFEQPLPKADVILMGHILHDWGIDDKRRLIRKAYDAVPEGGALIVYETIIDDDRSKNAFGLMMSLNMLIETPAGFDYTGADCQGWMKEAGFRETRVEHLAGPDSMVIGIR